MARARWWKDKRAWIESDAKKRAQEYADMKPGFWRSILFLLSKTSRKRWGTKAQRYKLAAKFYTNRLSHGVRRKTKEEVIAERRIARYAQEKRRKEIAEGTRYPIKMKAK